MLFETPPIRAAEFYKCVFLHLLLIILYSVVYSGIFLIIYPTTVLFWISLALLFAYLHKRAHSIIRASFFSPWFLVQIWLQPLLFIATLISISLFIVSLSEILGYAYIFRQILQLPIDAFTSFLYIYFLMVFSSGTYLFVEAIFRWFPYIKDIHLNSQSRNIARGTLIALFVIVIGGFYFILTYKNDNLNYVKGVIYENFQKPREAYALYSLVPKTDERLYQSARFRMARLHLLRFRDYKQALGHFSEVLEIKDSPLIDEALMQSLYCLYNLEKGFETLLPYYERLKQLNSHLSDEAGFLLTQRLLQLKRFDLAKELLNELANYSFKSLTVQSFLNSDKRRFSLTAVRAKEELKNIKAFSLNN